MDKYCKRLIEVDLPIKQISEHSRNEKNLRKGHPWHLHIWWARRPWGACRAVTLASLLPAPTDEKCPESFVNEAYKILCSVVKPKEKSRISIQESLLKFVGEYAQWELGSNSTYRNVAVDLVKAANEDNIPVVFDSFAGYGAIPGEAARLGCESIAGEINPVALLCLHTCLESIPKHNYNFIDHFHAGCKYILQESKKRLRMFYPKQDGKEVIAWLWARTIVCEGPGCGATFPLIAQPQLDRGKVSAWIEFKIDSKKKDVILNVKQGSKVPNNLRKTAGGGLAVCPVCNYTNGKSTLKNQANAGEMGHLLYGAAIAVGHRKGKKYVNTSSEDNNAFKEASLKWEEICEKVTDSNLFEKFPYHDTRAFTPGLYGIKCWGDAFSPRQKLALHTIKELIHDFAQILKKKDCSDEMSRDIITALALAVSNIVPYNNILAWYSRGMNYCYKGMGVSMKWDYGEANPLVSEYVGGLEFSFIQAERALNSILEIKNPGTIINANAADLPLPDDSVDIYFTDPPYYDTVPYADLSDFCYIWLKRYIGHFYPDYFLGGLTPKAEQILVNPFSQLDNRGNQSPEYYHKRMTKAFDEGRRVLRYDGIGAIVFAHKGTTAWETMLSSIIDAGFIVTASWPIDTERAARMRANNSAALGSSVHIIVRPRENEDGSLRTDDIGDWRDVLSELPKRIHEWMPRLGEEGVVGADAIFACLGPALEIYSRYSSVEKASGEKVELKEYLEEVWAAVSREALNMIFEGADASGFEEDARLTAMWLWTLRTTINGDEEEIDESGPTKSLSGYSLEYDAARKIAQGLGAYLENLSHLVEIKGDTATLLSVTARTRYLFGNDVEDIPKGKRKKKDPQMLLGISGELNQIEEESRNITGELTGKPGTTVIDQLHQSMILFAAGRSEAMKRFLIEEGVGRNPLFWRLAQALSALYPISTDEKRWVDGVLARKKGLGL